MKRDLVCLIRVIVDSMPPKFRNSFFLFNIAKKVFDVPHELFHFRRDFMEGKISDLSIYYKPISEGGLGTLKLSPRTDINSIHLRKIIKFITDNKPSTILDAGCGTGFLLDYIRLNTGMMARDLYGIDFSINNTSRNFNSTCGDLMDCLPLFDDNSIDMVLCTHVLEHLTNPQDVLRELRRIAKYSLVIICPIEKKFRWGMNYHIQFFESKIDFQFFIETSFERQVDVNHSYLFFLGDALLLESTH